MISADQEQALRESVPHVVGALTRRYGDFAAAEDAVQEALVAATLQWPRDGVPGNPRGWLIRVASRRLIDQLRAEAARRSREVIDSADPADGPAIAEDDSLALLFLCCHPELSSSSAVALTLRAVGGLTTAEIAQAYLVPEATMAQRISRAKQRIKETGLPLRNVPADEQPERLRTVLSVLYLIFNEGYVSSSGSSLVRCDLSDEAIRLTRTLHTLLPDQPEVTGLLALMLLTDARRDARADANGELISLADQDRSLWNAEAIAEGTSLVSTAMQMGDVGPYQLQAAIAALHDEAATADETDWAQIAALYAVLERMTDNPMVTLNRAVAVDMSSGPDAGLTLLESLDGDKRLARSHRLDAVRAHLLEMAGDATSAVVHYRAAAAMTTSTPEQRYLLKQAARVSDA